MTSLLDDHSGHGFRYLPRADVLACCARIDVVDAVREALVAHAKGQTTLPDEAYLGWRTDKGASARSLAMAGAVPMAGELALGLKVINGSLGNTDAGLARSQGFTMLFDRETARPTVVMEAAHISALRTAACTALSALHLGKPKPRVAVLGCGTLARTHLALLPATLDGLADVRLYDLDRTRAERLAEAVGGLDVTVAGSPEDCVRGADLVVAATTVTEGYIAHDWLAPGAVLAHVSLDDALPDVVERADLIVVDDWDLVRTDHRRLLGRMYRQRRLLGPDGSHHPGRRPDPGARRVDTTLGEVLLGSHPGRRSDTDIVLANPFGMAVLDVAVAARVNAVAVETDAGMRIPV
jgi:N-[(2S)-2-amino-2-carboxyethyl]-L-glutamate dehydrogenase